MFNSDSDTTDRHATGRFVRPFAAFAALLLLANVLAVPGAAAAPMSTNTAPTVEQPTIATVAENTPATNNSTATTPSDDGITMAMQARINPAIPNEDYVSVTIAKADAVYNTSGGFATFTSSQPLKAARITQPKASAQVLSGAHTIRVDYQDGAARRDTTSLYTLDLYFKDGSTKTVKLYASHTDISASTAIPSKWSPVVDYLQEQTESAGMKSTPQAALNYIKTKEDKAQLFSNLWSKKAGQYLALKFASMLNPFEWVELGVLGLIIVAFIGRKNNWLLKIQQVSPSLSAVSRAASKYNYEERKRAAAQHTLSDIQAIGGNNAALYWEKLGVETVEDMVQIACKGVLAQDESGQFLTDSDGNPIYASNGIEDLFHVEPFTKQNLREETWLKPLIMEGRLDVDTVLAHIVETLRVAEIEYDRGAEVRQDRRRAEQLLEAYRGDRDIYNLTPIDEDDTQAVLDNEESTLGDEDTFDNDDPYGPGPSPSDD